MPRLIRQVLVDRIRESPDLAAFLAAFPSATGMAVAYVDLPGQENPPPQIGTNGLEGRLWRDPSGRRLLTAFRHLLTEAADSHPAVKTCVSGLSAAAVPLRTGGQTVGFLVTAGFLTAPAGPLELNRIRHLLGREGVTLTASDLDALCREAPVVPPERQAALTLLLQWAADHLVSRLTERTTPSASEMPDLVRRSFGIIHAEFGSLAGVEELTHRLGVSEAHLSRTFHHAAGLRIVEYIARYRVERAHEKLISTNLPVAQVATACGFHSISQFNRIFRARFGGSPRTIRIGPQKKSGRDEGNYGQPGARSPAS